MLDSAPPVPRSQDRKYKDNTMLAREEYMTNLALAASVTAPGCVIECDVWKGGSSDGYPDWDGYARAFHEYLAAYAGVARIKQFQNSLYYVVKGARKW